jgi:hypothetical protein
MESRPSHPRRLDQSPCHWASWSTCVCLNDASISGWSSGGVSPARPFTWANLVGRDGIEPPTLRFSVVGPGVQQGADPVMVLVRWHPTEQAWAGFGRVLVDTDVDRRGLTSGQRLGASEAEPGGRPRLARPG